jgi:hypothetical protein
MPEQLREYIAPHIGDDLEQTRDRLHPRVRIVGEHPDDAAFLLVAFRNGLTAALPKTDVETSMLRAAEIHDDVMRQCRALGITLAVE